MAKQVVNGNGEAIDEEEFRSYDKTSKCSTLKIR